MAVTDPAERIRSAIAHAQTALRDLEHGRSALAHLDLSLAQHALVDASDALAKRLLTREEHPS